MANLDNDFKGKGIINYCKFWTNAEGKEWKMTAKLSVRRNYKTKDGRAIYDNLPIEITGEKRMPAAHKYLESKDGKGVPVRLNGEIRQNVYEKDGKKVFDLVILVDEYKVDYTVLDEAKVQSQPMAQAQPQMVQPQPMTQAPQMVQPQPMTQAPQMVQPQPMAQAPQMVQPQPMTQAQPQMVQPQPMAQPQMVQPQPIAQAQPQMVQPQPMAQAPQMVQPQPIAQAQPQTVQPQPIAQAQPQMVQPQMVQIPNVQIPVTVVEGAGNVNDDGFQPIPDGVKLPFDD